MRCIFTTVLFAGVVSAQYYVASTIAGNGQLPPPASGSVALNTRLVSPRNVATSASGKTYFSDAYYNQIYELTAAGAIEVVAGAGRQGFSGDNGPATAALLDSPGAMVFDSGGNLLFADTGNGRIRRITTDGVISTFASIGGVSGLAFDAAGNLYFSVAGQHTVRRLTPTGTNTIFAGTGTAGFSGDGGAATSAALNGPQGLRFDSDGNLYIADRSNHRIRRVTPGGVISTVIGDGVARLAGDNGPATSASITLPADIAIDATNTLYVSDTSSGRIRVVNRQGNITALAGGGRSFTDGGAGEAFLVSPVSMAFDSRGGLVIAVAGVRQIRRIVQTTITSLAGIVPGGSGQEGVPATNVFLLDPTHVAVDARGNVLVSDVIDNRVRIISPAGQLSTHAGNGIFGVDVGAGGALAAQVGSPRGLAFDSSGNLFIASGAGATIRRMTPAGIISNIAGGSGGFSGDNGPALNARLLGVAGVATDSAGNIYVADTGNNRIRRIAAGSQTITTIAGGATPGFSGDGGQAASALLAGPRDVAVDRANNIYIADTDNSRIRRIDTNGVITTVAGNGSSAYSGDGGAATAAAIGFPVGLAVDEAGNLYFPTGNAVRKVTASTQQISTIAGASAQGYSGDGALATNARFDFPFGVTVDAAGAVYVADARNFRVRKLTPARIVAEGVTNGATFRAGAVAPGEIISIFGFDLGPTAAQGLALGADGRVTTTLGGTQVTFDGVAAPLLLVSPGQVNAIVPYSVAGKESTRVQVTYQNRPTNTITLPVTATSPGVFAITNQDGSVNSAANPAAAGSVLILYGTGEGQTVPAGVDGAVATAVFPKPVQDVTVQIGSRAATVLYAGAAPGFVSGVLQLNVQIPAGVTGTIPISVKIGDAATPTGLNVTVR
jgi:uncharacterized protein (TIGR03437 family)